MPNLTAEPVAKAESQAPPKLAIKRGVCCPLFAFDIAFAIDLDQAERLLSAGVQRENLRPVRKSPSYFEFKPAPLRINLDSQPLTIAGRATLPTVELVAFDFGAVLVSYRIPINCELDTLVELGTALFDNPELLADARAKARAFADRIASATRKPWLTPQVEDYAIFQIEEIEVNGQAASPTRLLELAPTLLAQILRSERAAMSNDQIADALGCRLSYRPDDAAIIDWNAAILLDREADDVRPVLEFANVELLEMRFLDDRLDEILDEAYRTSQSGPGGWWRLFPSGSSGMRRIAQLQIESAVLFEGVNNAIKLIGDQYLARVYRLAAQRFHLPERDETIERKLQTLQSIYSKMSDHQSGRRTETLEWIVIILIFIEMVMGLATLRH